MQQVLDVQVARQLLLQTVMRMTGTSPRPREVGLYQNLTLLFCMFGVFLTFCIEQQHLSPESLKMQSSGAHRGCWHSQEIC